MSGSDVAVFVLPDVVAELRDTLGRAEADAAESCGMVPNSHGAGYDTGYRDGLRRALRILRRLDGIE